MERGDPWLRMEMESSLGMMPEARRIFVVVAHLEAWGLQFAGLEELVEFKNEFLAIELGVFQEGGIVVKALLRGDGLEKEGRSTPLGVWRRPVDWLPFSRCPWVERLDCSGWVWAAWARVKRFGVDRGIEIHAGLWCCYEIIIVDLVLEIDDESLRPFCFVLLHDCVCQSVLSELISIAPSKPVTTLVLLIF